MASTTSCNLIQVQPCVSCTPRLGTEGAVDMRHHKGATGVDPLAKVDVQIGSFSDQVTAGVTDDTDWVTYRPRL